MMASPLATHFSPDMPNNAGYLL